MIIISATVVIATCLLLYLYCPGLVVEDTVLNTEK